MTTATTTTPAIERQYREAITLDISMLCTRLFGYEEPITEMECYALHSHVAIPDQLQFDLRALAPHRAFQTAGATLREKIVFRQWESKRMLKRDGALELARRCYAQRDELQDLPEDLAAERYEWIDTIIRAALADSVMRAMVAKGDIKIK